MLAEPASVTEESAIRAMGQLAKDAGRKGFAEKDLLVDVPFCPQGGIRSALLVSYGQFDAVNRI